MYEKNNNNKKKKTDTETGGSFMNTSLRNITRLVLNVFNARLYYRSKHALNSLYKRCEPIAGHIEDTRSINKDLADDLHV